MRTKTLEAPKSDKRAAVAAPFTLLDVISKKRDGGKHTKQELAFLAKAAGDGSAPDYQLSAWLMAVVLKGMDVEETAALTEAMARSGESLELRRLKPVVDKHSTGGVGDGVSLALAPIVAACGVTVPMMSGRGLGHTGGTLDKLEAIPGFRTGLKPSEITAQLQSLRVAMFGQSERLAPADRKIYALRDATGTVGSVPLIVASILSKKLAEDLDALVLDVKAGSGAIFETEAQAEELARALTSMAKKLGLKCAALLTAMDEPLGLAVGNGVEVAQAVQVLTGDHRAKDYVEVLFGLGGWMVHLAGKARTPDEGAEMCQEKVAHGAALEKFRQMVAKQGGDARVVDDPYHHLPRSRHALAVRSPAEGILQKLDARKVGQAARALGAGRLKAEDPVDLSAGILLGKKVGDPCTKDEVLATLYASDRVKLEQAQAEYLQAVVIGPRPVFKKPVIRKVLR